MKFRGLLVAIAVLAVLGGLVFWSNKKKATADTKPAADASPKLLSIPDVQFKQIKLAKTGGDTTVLTRGDGNKWQITQPEVLLYDSPTGGLDPVTSNTIVELIVKQRDVYKTSALMVTHRLQDAFTMATHQFDKATNRMVALPKGQRGEVPMSFLILRDGKVIFDGDAQKLVTSRDDYIREYIS